MLLTFGWQHCQWHCLQKCFCLKLPNSVRNAKKIFEAMPLAMLPTKSLQHCQDQMIRATFCNIVKGQAKYEIKLCIVHFLLLQLLYYISDKIFYNQIRREIASALPCLHSHLVKQYIVRNSGVILIFRVI